MRIIAATNRNLADEVAAGKFRQDLYYRVNVLRIVLPPLRDRRGDLELLVKHFVGAYWSLDEDATAAVMDYHWPGNVRQLINAIQRGKPLSDDGVIRRCDLPLEVVEKPASHNNDDRLSNPTLSDDAVDLATLNRRFVQETLARANGNKAEAARLLGIHRRSLYRLIERYSLD